MNRRTFYFAMAAVLSVGAVLGYFAGQQHAPTAEDSVAMTGKERRILYWHDPMVPNVKFDKPGKSPYMDMQLVPVYADENGAVSAVRINSQVTQNLGVRLAKVERIELRPTLSAVGSVTFDERLVQVVQSRVEGYVTRLHVRAPLQIVRRGEALADILSPQWLAAQEEYLALLQAQSERGQAIREAARQRLVVLGVPEPSILALERERKPVATTTVFSPIEGVVSELSVREGAAFAVGAPLFRINGLETVWVNAQVPEAQVAMLSPGASVSAQATAWPGTSFPGRVVAILPDMNPQTRTLAVRLELENSQRKLAPGMFVSLSFSVADSAPQLAVPSEALIETGERSVVILAREGGRFDVAQVTTGAEADGKTAILSGLTEGQTVVQSGQFLIDSEASLRSALDRLVEPAERSP